MYLRDEVFRATLFTPRMSSCRRRLLWGLSVIIPGPPGVSKTARVFKVGHESGFAVYVFETASKLPSDLNGVPSLVPHTLPDGTTVMVTTYGVPKWAAETHDRPMIVFMDDITAGATPNMLAALTGTIHDHILGDGFALGPDTRVVAAMNPRWCAAGGCRISAPVANRLLTLPVLLDAKQKNVQLDQTFYDQWAEYFLAADDSFAEPAPIDHARVAETQADVMKVWPAAYAEARARVVSFTQAVPTFVPVEDKGKKAANERSYSSFYEIPRVGEPGSDGSAWASPRALELASRGMACAAVHKLTGLEAKELVKGSVGDLWAEQFYLWEGRAALPSGFDMLNGKGDTWDFSDHSTTYAVLAAATSHMMTLDRESQVEVLPAMVRMMLRCTEAGQCDEAARPLQRLARSSVMTARPSDAKLPAADRPSAQIASLMGNARLRAYATKLKELDSDAYAALLGEKKCA